MQSNQRILKAGSARASQLPPYGSGGFGLRGGGQVEGVLSGPRRKQQDVSLEATSLIRRVSRATAQVFPDITPARNDPPFHVKSRMPVLAGAQDYFNPA
jgi:hypothetical protein